MADTITRITRAIRRVPPPLGVAAAVVVLDLAGRAALQAWGARLTRREVADEEADWHKIRRDWADHDHREVMDGVGDVLGALQDVHKVLEEIRDQEPIEDTVDVADLRRDWSAEDTVQAFRALRRDGLSPELAARYVCQWQRRAAQ